MAKHSASALGPARIVLSGAVAVLVMLVVWVAVRAVGPAEASHQPQVVLPSMPQAPVAVSSSPSLSPSPSRSASHSPSPSPSSKRPSARRSATSHTPVRERTTAPAPALSVSVSLGASWEQGYVAMVRVRNTGRAATTTWKVTVRHSGEGNLRFTGAWGAVGSQSVDNVVLTGGPLAAGASASAGYQVSTTGRGNARPAGCTVVGGTCSVS